jgi:hypothetical protein
VFYYWREENMKQFTLALLAAGLLALPAACTRQGAQEEQQQPQESVVPGEEGTMEQEQAPMGTEEQGQETVLPQDQQQDQLQQDQMQPQDQQAHEQTEPMQQGQ